MEAQICPHIFHKIFDDKRFASHIENQQRDSDQQIFRLGLAHCLYDFRQLLLAQDQISGKQQQYDDDYRVNNVFYRFSRNSPSRSELVFSSVLF